MKLIRHTKPPRYDEVKLKNNPLVIFIARDVELRIEKGDTLTTIGTVISREAHLPAAKAIALAGYYFSLGERYDAVRQTQPWKTRDKQRGADRRYLMLGTSANDERTSKRHAIR
jgi:hypothetical protein